MASVVTSALASAAPIPGRTTLAAQLGERHVASASDGSVVGAQDDEPVLQTMPAQHTRIGDPAHATGARNRVTTGATAIAGGTVATPGPAGGA